MPLAKCVKNCYDSKIGQLYYRGDIVEDMPADHPFLKNGCFVAEKKAKKEEPVFDEPEAEEKRGPGRPRREDK